MARGSWERGESEGGEVATPTRALTAPPSTLHLPQALSLVEGVLHLRDGVYYRFLSPAGDACGGALVEQALFAHRSRRHLLLQRLRLVGDGAEACAVHLRAANASAPAPGEACCTRHAAAWGVCCRSRPTPCADFTNSTVAAATRGSRTYAVRTMETALAECPACVRPSVAIAWDPVPASVQLSPGSGVLLGAALVTSLEGDAPGSLADAAVTRLHAAHTEGAASLLLQHVSGWAAQWRGGVEVEGNATVARAANASLYYLRSSVREDWPYSLSPGGLSTDAYHGHRCGGRQSVGLQRATHSTTVRPPPRQLLGLRNVDAARSYALPAGHCPRTAALPRTAGARSGGQSSVCVLVGGVGEWGCFPLCTLTPCVYAAVCSYGLQGRAVPLGERVQRRRGHPRAPGQPRGRV